MNKEEILYEIEKTKLHLTNMEKMLGECEYERWKPADNENYWYIDDNFDLRNVKFTNSLYDEDKIKTYNCFQSREQAEAEAEKILIRRQLEDIARRLNKGQKIDWSDENQCKWYIIYNTTFGFETYSVSKNTTQGTVYCLDKDFLNTAIQETGEERLKKIFEG